MKRIGRLLGRILRRERPERGSPPPSPGGRGPATLLRAGDIALEGGRKQEALALYGRALDGYLEAGARRKAERICRIMIGIEPGVIRTRYTLAAIAVGRDRFRQSRARLEDYMRAVAAAGAQHLAVPSLVELASATPNARIRGLIAAALAEGGRPDLGTAVREGRAAPAAEDRWRGAVEAALTRPDEVDLGTLVPS